MTVFAGESRRLGSTPNRAARAHLALVAGQEPSGLIEIRYRRSDGRMGQLFHDARRAEALSEGVVDLGQRTDTYIGAAPRTEPRGGRDAVARTWALWVDCDDEDAADRLRAFTPAASMLLRSGRDGGLHGWWSLAAPLDARWLKRALGRLAHHLGGDPQCVDNARIMRGAGTLNHKHSPPRPTEVERLELGLRHNVRSIVGHLPDPHAEPVRRYSGPRELPADDVLFGIASSEYTALLTGRHVRRDGKVSCPFHDETDASLQTYDDPARGWVCFGCQRGGSIIDFGAALYAITPRGRGFHDIRRRLASDLLRVAA